MSILKKLSLQKVTHLVIKDKTHKIRKNQKKSFQYGEGETKFEGGQVIDKSVHLYEKYFSIQSL
jgi:hypothetical protein